MSSTKDRLNEMEIERHRKQEALLNVPNQISEAHFALEVLAERLENSAVEIADLKGKLTEAASFMRKLKDNLVGFLIGCASSFAIWYLTARIR